MFVGFTLLLAGCWVAPAPAEDIVRNDASGLSAAAVSPRRGASGVGAETLNQFWTRFRRAALAGDAAALRAMSATMVIQHSTLDDTPVVKLPSERVPAAVAKILALPDGVDAAGRIHRDILKATPVAKRDGQQTADTYLFGDMVFARGKTGWRLTELYRDD